MESMCAWLQGVKLKVGAGGCGAIRKVKLVKLYLERGREGGAGRSCCLWML